MKDSDKQRRQEQWERLALCAGEALDQYKGELAIAKAEAPRGLLPTDRAQLWGRLWNLYNGAMVLIVGLHKAVASHEAEAERVAKDMRQFMQEREALLADNSELLEALSQAAGQIDDLEEWLVNLTMGGDDTR